MSKVKLWLPKWIISLRYKEPRVCIHFNGNSTNWSNVKNGFLKELFLAGKNDRSHCQSLKRVVFHRNIPKRVKFLPVIIITECNKAILKQTITKTKKEVRVVANYLKFRPASNKLKPNSRKSWSNSRVEEKLDPQFIILHEVIGSTKQFQIFLIKVRFTQRCLQDFIKRFLIVRHFTVQNFFSEMTFFIFLKK